MSEVGAMSEVIAMREASEYFNKKCNSQNAPLKRR
jgi:hypothetical protein